MPLAGEEGGVLTVTDDAARHLATLLERAEASQEVAVRIVATRGGLRMRLDEEGAEDETVEFEGRKVLVMGPQTAEALEDRILDTRPTATGSTLTLRHQDEV